MDITITTTIKSNDRWEGKRYGVILVNKETDIELVFRYLYKQDDYWENYRDLIQIRPSVIRDENDIKCLCAYTGKTSIYDMPKFIDTMGKCNIDIFVYQYQKESDD